MATYNCVDSTSNAYGSGGYGTCTGQSVGAPNTGVFSELVSGGSITILAPFVVAIVLVGIAALVVRHRMARRR